MEVQDVTVKDAQTWERCLWTSDGALKLHKCKYYILYWTFDDKGKPSLMQTTFLLPISLTSGVTPLTMNIQQLDCNEAHETLNNWLLPDPHEALGNWLAPDLNTKNPSV